MTGQNLETAEVDGNPTIFGEASFFGIFHPTSSSPTRSPRSTTAPAPPTPASISNLNFVSGAGGAGSKPLTERERRMEEEEDERHLPRWLRDRDGADVGTSTAATPTAGRDDRERADGRGRARPPCRRSRRR